MINNFAEVSLSSDADHTNCELHAEEVVISTTLSAIHVDIASADETAASATSAEWIESEAKLFVGPSPSRCFIGCESMILIPCTPCCIYIPAVRTGIGCVQLASRVCVLVPVISLLFVLLCPFVYASIVYDCFQSENRCVPDRVRPEQVLLSYLLCAPYNPEILENSCWSTVHRDECQYFGDAVSPDIVPYFY